MIRILEDEGLIPGLLKGEIPVNSERGRKARFALFRLLVDPGVDPDFTLGVELRRLLAQLFLHDGMLEIKPFKESRGDHLVTMALGVARLRRREGYNYDAAIAQVASDLGRPKKTVARAYTKYHPALKLATENGFFDLMDAEGVRIFKLWDFEEISEFAEECRAAGGKMVSCIEEDIILVKYKELGDEVSEENKKVRPHKKNGK